MDSVVLIYVVRHPTKRPKKIELKFIKGTFSTGNYFRLNANVWYLEEPKVRYLKGVAGNWIYTAT